MDDSPNARYCSSLGFINKDIILFGGRSKINSKLNFDDTWKYNSKWTKLKNNISPFYHAKTAYSSDGNNMYIFSGEGPNGHVSDLWMYNKQNKWNQLLECKEDDPILW